MMLCSKCLGPLDISRDPGSDNPQTTSSRAVWELMRGALASKKKEEFWVLLLDVKNRVIGKKLVSVGSLCASLVHPREAFIQAVKAPAHAVIFVHNHPSGDPEPSPEDGALTRRLVAAGDILGIKVLDHVVIGSASWFSFADAGRLSE